ncbi:hypothetical protein QGN29_10900 [Temperatibacter marinus]|uniref:Uncharacterized protein n=1 Tax=Temperatibacter marinus TaxID=1456591 RepID=A0AA52EC90_9PROT|nr:hypothetical protein [Temperatibacter marinus]WND02055.1 hypothetical protein QGN29_10900 [Temperatibacter marinus]
MAHHAVGETSLKVGEDIFTLRLTLGGMQDLEDFGDCSLFTFWDKTFEGNSLRVGNFLTILAVMLGEKAGSKEAELQAFNAFHQADLSLLIEKVATCFNQTLNPREGPGKPKMR